MAYKSANSENKGTSDLDKMLNAPKYIQNNQPPPDANTVKPIVEDKLPQANPAPANPSPVPYVPPNMNNTINDLYKAQEQARMTSLETAKQKALSTLNQEKSAMQPQYYDKRNQAAGMAQQQANNFAEFMAQRGGIRSGANAQTEIARNNALLGNINQINLQEQQALNDIGRRQAMAELEYQNALQQGKSELDAQRLQAILDQNRYDQSQALQIAGLTGMLNGARTLQGQEFDRSGQQQALQNEFARAGLTGMLNGQQTLQGRAFDREGQQMDRQNTYTEAGLTGMLNGVQTMQGRQADIQNQLGQSQIKAADFNNYYNSIKGLGDSFDYMGEINSIKSDNDPNNDWQIAPLMQARNEKIMAKKADERTQSELDFTKALNMWKQYPANDFVANTLGVPVGSRSQDFNVGQANISSQYADSAYKSGKLALDQKSQAMDSAYTQWKMSPNNPDNQPKAEPMTENERYASMLDILDNFQPQQRFEFLGNSDNYKNVTSALGKNADEILRQRYNFKPYVVK